MSKRHIDLRSLQKITFVKIASQSVPVLRAKMMGNTRTFVQNKTAKNLVKIPADTANYKESKL